jgi:hypothetical protein
MIITLEEHIVSVFRIKQLRRLIVYLLTWHYNLVNLNLQ